MVETVTNIQKLSPTDFVSNIRHQYQCNRSIWSPNFGQSWTDPHVQTKDLKSLKRNDKLILEIFLQAAFFQTSITLIKIVIFQPADIQVPLILPNQTKHVRLHV